MYVEDVEDTVPTKPAVSRPSSGFAGVRVAVIPLPALGDLTIYLRLGWLFHRAGAEVTFYSNALYPARAYFPWLRVLRETDNNLEALARLFDLLVVYRKKGKNWGDVVPENVAFVAAKRISGDTNLAGQSVTVKGRAFHGASRPFCLDSRAGITMVDWVDSYANEVFGLELDTLEGFLHTQPKPTSEDLALVFPTTPEPKKNYWLTGFQILARKLRRQGWRVEFICMPNEQNAIAAKFSGYPVRSFPDIKALMDHISCAKVVVSNDSGGGHLGSMMGLRTFTITRRSENFVWRPGFNRLNTVVAPRFRFKWLGGEYIWRPFIPISRIAAQIGKPTCG